MNLSFSVSARNKPETHPISQLLTELYPNVNIDGVFGFTHQTPLNGGRVYKGVELSSTDISWLTASGIQLMLPFSNLFVTDDDYVCSRWILDGYTEIPTTIIVSNDALAKWIKRDYPMFHLELSACSDISSIDAVKRGLEHYDTVVLQSNMNTIDFLEKIEDKHRIRLFANSGCPYRCPAKVCYATISKRNQGTSGSKYTCATQFTDYKPATFVEFDVGELAALGYSKFKLTHVSQMGNYPTEKIHLMGEHNAINITST